MVAFNDEKLLHNCGADTYNTGMVVGPTYKGVDINEYEPVLKRNGFTVESFTPNGERILYFIKERNDGAVTGKSAKRHGGKVQAAPKGVSPARRHSAKGDKKRSVSPTR